MANIITNILSSFSKPDVPVSTRLLFARSSLDHKEDAAPITRSGIADSFKRVSKRELKLAYLRDPIIFNTVNKYVQLMLSTGYRLVGDDQAIAVVDNFLNNLGNTGTDIEKETFFQVELTNLLIFGSAFAEKIYNKGRNKIIDLELVDPENFDLATNYDDKVVLDEYNDPIGYVQSLPFDVEKPRVVFPFPEGVSNPSGTGLFIPKDRVLHFRLYNTGDGINDYGLVEPIYANAMMKKNIEDSFSNYLSRLGYPIVYGKLGDVNHPVTEEQLKNFAEDLRKLRNRDILALYHYADIGILEPKSPEGLQGHLNYFNDQEVAGLGMPKAFSLGSGEETNRATLNRQEYFMKITVKSILKRFSSHMEKRLFKPLCKQHGLDTYPKMIWADIALEELDSKSERLTNYAKSGLLIPDEKVQDYVRAMEDLPKKPHKIDRPPEIPGDSDAL